MNSADRARIAEIRIKTARMRVRMLNQLPSNDYLRWKAPNRVPAGDQERLF